MKAQAVNYCGDPDQKLDYTTMADAAAFTAAAALDPQAPEIVRVAGQTVTARELAAIASELTGKPFSLHSDGSIEDLAAAIKAEIAAHPEQQAETFPRFQQLQYTHNMQSGRARLTPLDNGRYDVKPTTVRELLARAMR